MIDIGSASGFRHAPGLAPVLALVLLSMLTGCGTNPSTYQAVHAGGPAGSKAGGQVDSVAPAGVKLVPAIVGAPPDPSAEELVLRVAASDNLRVDVFGVPEFSGEFVVNTQGSIIMPLIGAVPVADLTLPEAESAIARRLGERYVRDPRVTVTTKSSQSSSVIISGYGVATSVQSIPGRVPMTILLSRVGGISALGRKRHVVLYRRKGTPGVPPEQDIQAYVIDYQEILDAKARDPMIVAGDRIYVPPTLLALFFNPWFRTVQTYAAPLGVTGATGGMGAVLY